MAKEAKKGVRGRDKWLDKQCAVINKPKPFSFEPQSRINYVPVSGIEQGKWSAIENILQDMMKGNSEHRLVPAQSSCRD
jgi:hypothetical protein